jgi:hypothetical protein
MQVGDLVRGDFSSIGEQTDPDQMGIIVKASEQQVSIHWTLDGCTLHYARKWWHMLEVVNESR